MPGTNAREETTHQHAHHSHHALEHFPLRAKPEYYRQSLYKILTRAQGQGDGFALILALLEKLDIAQQQMLGRELTAQEHGILRLRSLRDLRASLLALGATLTTSTDFTETQIRRTRNLPFLQWRVEKEILSMHWGCNLQEIEDRQLRSGLRMPQFLADSIENEGLN